MSTNKVELIGIYGSDETIALSAWTSTSRDLPEEKRKRIPAIIHQLYRDGHHTPFEKSTLHFLVDTDIATHIQLLKHRIGVSINAESARYKELKEDKYYLPNDWTDIKATRLKGDMATHNGKDWLKILQMHSEIGNQLYHACLADLDEKLGRKRAKESARFFKGYNSQIQSDISFNMRSFLHFINLRNTREAQLEINIVAQKMLKAVMDSNKFEHTIDAWVSDIRSRD
jgi:flavin-dependent thymidylate synthase